MATPTPETESHQDTTPPFTFEQAIEKHKQEDSTTMGNIGLGQMAGPSVY